MSIDGLAYLTLAGGYEHDMVDYLLELKNKPLHGDASRVSTAGLHPPGGGRKYLAPQAGGKVAVRLLKMTDVPVKTGLFGATSLSYFVKVYWCDEGEGQEIGCSKVHS